MSRDEKIMSFSRLVRRIAWNIAKRLPCNGDVEDLYQCGMIGIMKAVDSYDESRSRTFKSYAKQRAVGEMFDYLRLNDFMSRKGRTALKKGGEVLGLHTRVYGMNINQLKSSVDVHEFVYTYQAGLYLSGIFRTFEGRNLAVLRSLLFKRLTMKQIGHDLNCSESRVSMLFTDIRRTLAIRLKRSPFTPLELRSSLEIAIYLAFSK